MSVKQQDSKMGRAGLENLSSNDFRHKVTIDYANENKDSFIYKVEIIVGQFKPRDFKIKLKENVLTISGSRQVNSSNDNDSNNNDATGQKTIELKTTTTINHGANSDLLANKNNNKQQSSKIDSSVVDLNAKSRQLKQMELFKRIIILPEFIDTKTASCYLETYDKAPNVLKIEASVKKEYRKYVEELLFAQTTKNDDEIINLAKADGLIERGSGIRQSRQSKNSNDHNHNQHHHQNRHSNLKSKNYGSEFLMNDSSNKNDDYYDDNDDVDDERSLGRNQETFERMARQNRLMRTVNIKNNSQSQTRSKEFNDDNEDLDFMEQNFNAVGISSGGRLRPSSSLNYLAGKTASNRSQSLKSIDRCLNGGGSGTLFPNDEASLYGSGVLKYKFDLRNFESKNISITIRKNNILTIRAFNDCYDTYGRVYNEFSREINLPDNVEIHNIRNCFDEYEGILRIEVPLKTSKFKSNNELSQRVNTVQSTESLVETNDYYTSRSSNGRLNDMIVESTSYSNSPLARAKSSQNAGGSSSTSSRRNDSSSNYNSLHVNNSSSSSSSNPKRTQPPPLQQQQKSQGDAVLTPTARSRTLANNDNHISDAKLATTSSVVDDTAMLRSNEASNKGLVPKKAEFEEDLLSASDSKSKVDDKTRNLNDNLKSMTNENTGSNKSEEFGANDKYLELIFDLTGYKFQNTNIVMNKNEQKVLIIKAFKYVAKKAANEENSTADANKETTPKPAEENASASPSKKESEKKATDAASTTTTTATATGKASTNQMVRKLFIRKYILPDWIDSSRIKIIQNNNNNNSNGSSSENGNNDANVVLAGTNVNSKNLLIIHLPIIN